MTTEKQTLKLDQIRTDGGTQPRVAIDQGIVDEYAEKYDSGVDLKPVIVFFDGATYWLADGFHRYWATRKIGRDVIAVEVHQGTQRDAILYSVGANATHGLRRTNADKRKAVLTMLTEPKVNVDENGNPWSDQAISKMCRVSAPFVAKMRSTHQGDLTLNVYSDTPPQCRAYKTRHGTKAVMNTANIGRSRASSSGRHSTGKMARDAFMPAPHSDASVVPMRSVKLPLNDPEQAARSMFSLFDDEWMRRMATEALRHIANHQTTEGNE